MNVKNFKQRIISFVLVVVMIMGILPTMIEKISAAGFVARTTEPSTNDKHYYSDNPYNQYPDLAMPNCTTYAWGRAYELLGHKPNISTNGNASDWWDNNKNNLSGYPYNENETLPKLGAIACWSGGSDGCGHVAVVEKIDGNNVYISESAYGRFGAGRYSNGKGFRYGSTVAEFTGGSYKFQGYIYIGEWTQGYNPQGFLDSVTGGAGTITVRGWTFDRDALNSAIGIHVYIGSEYIGEGVANISRTDVNTAYPGVGNNHGFEFKFTTNKRGTQEVSVYAINAPNTSGENVLLGKKTVNISKDSDPQGHLDSVTGGAGKIAIRGWAFDRDALNSSVEIHVYIGGPAGSSNAEAHNKIYANQNRSDVNKTYSGVGDNHGYSQEITTNKTGSQTVYVYAINVLGTVGENVFLGSQTVNISNPAPKILDAPTLSCSKSGTNITMNWNNVLGATSYSVTICKLDGAGDFIPISGVNRLKVTSTNYMTSSLIAGRYSAVVVANNDAGSSKQSNIVYIDIEPVNYTITYDANGGTGAPTSQKITGNPIILSSVKPTRSGYNFLGWSMFKQATSASFQSGESINISPLANTTLYAVWQAQSAVVTPIANISGGEIANNTKITLSTTTSGATIYYTTDGSAPTTSSTKYSSPITITKAITIKAIAVKSGMTNSSVATFNYTVKKEENKLTELTLFVSNGKDGLKYKDSCDIYLGNTFSEIAIDCTPLNSQKNIVVTSSNPDVVSISYTSENIVSNANRIVYKLIANKEGRATITAKDTISGLSKSIIINVIKVKVDNIILSPTQTNLKVGEKSYVQILFTPSNPTNLNVNCYSSDNSIISIKSPEAIMTKQGTVLACEVTALKSGSATLTVITEDGNKKATCQITVISDEATQAMILSIKVDTKRVNKVQRLCE